MNKHTKTCHIHLIHKKVRTTCISERREYHLYTLVTLCKRSEFMIDGATKARKFHEGGGLQSSMGPTKQVDICWFSLRLYGLSSEVYSCLWRH